MNLQISKKVILIGNFGVGKTSLIRQYVHQKFSEDYLTTLGVKIDKKVIALENAEINIIIWDIAGEVSQTKVPKSYYLGAGGIIYVLDVSRPSSFQYVKEDVDYVNSVLPNIPMCIAANKRDLINDEEFKLLPTLLPVVPDFYTSAREGYNVENLFKSMAEKILNNA